MFMCQRDSFLKELETEILSCDPVSELDTFSRLSIDPKVLDADVGGRSKLFKIVLLDTIFFPEGGGQPDDHGIITCPTGDSEGQVIRCVRNGTLAEHYVTVPEKVMTTFSPGDKAITKIDWTRRFDHMQQHSGQHLITAVADAKFGFPTTSWWLGSEESYIELDTKQVSEDEMLKIEEEVNARIRENVTVNVDVVTLDDPKLKKARGRNLLHDVKENIRIVTMVDVESNVCCGTHVSNLSQLQVVKLLFVIKKNGKCLLHFLSGNRVVLKFAAMLEREQRLVEILKSSSVELPEAGQKLNLALKNARKSNQTLSKDLAVLVAKQFKEKNGNGNDKLWMYHRENVDLDFGMALLREIGDAKDSTVILVTMSGSGSSGCFLLVGDDKIVPKEKLVMMGEVLCNILDGKGFLLKGNLYQAKVNKINAIVKAQRAAQKFVEDLYKEN